MAKHRLLFEKTGRAIYLSHLDLMRTLQRVFYRADVFIRHTEGFNPHAYVSVLLPLSVGMESVCELLEFELLGGATLEDLPGVLNEKMPEGIRVIKAYESQRKVRELAFASYTGVWEYDGLASPEGKIKSLEDFFAQGEIFITKRTKKKAEAQVDIKALLRDIRFRVEAGQIKLEATVFAQNPGLNPNLLCTALVQHAPELAPDFAQFTRLEVFDENMEVFR